MLPLPSALLALRATIVIVLPAMLGLAVAGTMRAACSAAPPQGKPSAAEQASAEQKPGDAAAQGALRVVPPLELAGPVRKVLQPMFDALRTADTTRVTAEMSLASKANGAPIDVQRGTYQIVSRTPNHLDAHLKGRDQRMRVVSDGQRLIMQLTPDAYITAEAPAEMNAFVGGVAIPFGPFPEFIFSITLAGVDPAAGLLGGVQDVRLIEDDQPLQDDHSGAAARHLRAQRADGVVWDLWIVAGEHPRPLRLEVDLTAMLVQTNQLNLPEGFTYVMETTFSHWETGVELEPKAFQYQPPAEATEYESLQAFIESLSQDAGPHPLLGQQAPALQSSLLDGQEVQLKQHRGKAVVVLDFWATWCSPCVAALPILSEVTEKYRDRDVVFYAVNVGEKKAQIDEFLKQQELDLPVMLDPDGEIAGAYQAQAIPQTVLIGKDGRIEAVHVGFAGPKALREILAQELDVLVEGRPLIVEDPAEKGEQEAAKDDAKADGRKRG